MVSLIYFLFIVMTILKIWTSQMTRSTHWESSGPILLRKLRQSRQVVDHQSQAYALAVTLSVPSAHLSLKGYQPEVIKKKLAHCIERALVTLLSALESQPPLIYQLSESRTEGREEAVSHL